MVVVTVMDVACGLFSGVTYVAASVGAMIVVGF